MAGSGKVMPFLQIVGIRDLGLLVCVFFGLILVDVVYFYVGSLIDEMVWLKKKNKFDGVSLERRKVLK